MVRLRIALASALVLLVAAGAWMYFFRAPPLRIAIVTGTKNLAYYNFGQEYAKALKLKSIDVRVLPTRGSVDNLALLRNPKSRVIQELMESGIIGADDAALLRDPKTSVIALIQGGIIHANDAPDLESLGTVFYEPLWLFRRRDAGKESSGNLREKRDTTRIETNACRRSRHGIFRRVASPPQSGINSLRGKTIAVGPNGSGIQPLACELLWRHRITRRVGNLMPMETGAAVDALLNGTVDAAFIVASWDAPSVQQLLDNPDIELVDYPQADAYADHYSYLHKVVLHRGASDFEKDRPPANVSLIATKASLIVQKDLPFAIQYLLLNAARQIHSKRGVLQATGEFPSAEVDNVQLTAMAQQFYKPGLPYYLNDFLMNRLWFSIAGPIAEPINKLVIPMLLVIGTLTVLTPLGRLAVIIYTMYVQRPVSRLLRKVMDLEKKLDAPGGKENAGRIAFELDGVKDQVIRRLRRYVPAALVAPLLVLRHQHIDALRKRLEQYTGSVAEPPPEHPARSLD
jgi:TRAP-type uncharacterized transport system substrate-binding protein